MIQCPILPAAALKCSLWEIKRSLCQSVIFKNFEKVGKFNCCIVCILPTPYFVEITHHRCAKKRYYLIYHVIYPEACFLVCLISYPCVYVLYSYGYCYAVRTVEQ